MKSLDTNLLFYSMNEDCAEHAMSNQFVTKALRSPQDWIIADQTWFELYRLLRNPKLLKHPLAALEADEKIDYFRNRSGWSICAWEPRAMDALRQQWKRADFPTKRTFDLVLAHTLKANGVKEFYTRNTKDFEAYGFFQVIDPLA